MSSAKSPSVMFSGNGELSPALVREFSVQAEEAGFNGVWFGETTLRDASVLATVAACSTKRIGLGTSIVNVFTRSPSQLALLGVTVNELSGGRFTLGLGVSTAAIVEVWHGQKFARPFDRLEETVTLLRRYFSGEKFSYHGKYSSPLNARLRTKPAPPIALAALNDQMVKRAATLADRIILNLNPPENITQSVKVAEQASKDAGKPRPVMSVMLYAQLVGSGEQGLDAAKELVSFYASAPAYSRLFSGLGFTRESHAMMEAWKAKDKDAVKRLVSEEMVNRLMVLGGVRELRERVEQYHEAGIDDVFICPSPFGDYEANFREVLANYF